MECPCGKTGRPKADASAQIFAGFHQIDGGERRRRDAGRQTVGKQIGPRALAQQIDQHPPTGDIAAAGSAQGLAERAGQQIDAVVGALGGGGTITFSQTGAPVITRLPFAAVPEPSTLLLLGSGLAGLAGAAAWRRHRRT